jgi:hypothetical protein
MKGLTQRQSVTDVYGINVVRSALVAEGSSQPQGASRRNDCDDACQATSTHVRAVMRKPFSSSDKAAVLLRAMR